MNLTSVDIIAGILLAISFWRGWRKGLLRAILGPACLLLFSIIGVIHFDLTHNMATSILLTLQGTVILSLLIRLVLIIGRARVPKEERDFVFVGSRVLGSIISLLWVSALIGVILILWATIPVGKGAATDIQRNILRSRAYVLANELLVYPHAGVRHGILTFQVLVDPSHLKELSAHPEFETFIDHPKVQNILRDPGILICITKKDYLKLFSEPRIWEVIRDDALMKCLSKVSQTIYEEKNLRKGATNQP